MRLRLKGIASATKKLADGTKRTYWYAWRGGPQLPGQPGSQEFMAAYNAAVAQRRTAPEGTFKAIIAAYLASPAYAKLSKSSKTAYRSYLGIIEKEFGDVPLAALEDRRMRGDFLEWRDSFADTPRKADYLWQVLNRVLSFAKNRGKIGVNVCERGGRLYASDRSDMVWSDADIEKLFLASSDEIHAAVTLAIATGQRLGDLLRLTWASYDGERITLRQSKSRRSGKQGRLVVIPVGQDLRGTLESLRADNEARQSPSATILTSTEGKPWSVDGFKTSFGRALARAFVDDAGLPVDADLHFHDFRGTAVTRLALAGCTVPEIASITGHTLASAQSIVDRYLARDPALAESAISKLEANKTRS